MIKRPYRNELLETMASLFSLSTPLFASKTDIESSARQSYVFRAYLKGDDITIQYKNGTITLRGKAASTAQKDLTAEYAKDVEGVNDVSNQMTVTPASLKTGEKIRKEADTTGESIDDASVTALVKTTLSYHRSTRSLGITVKTKDGVVKLEGEAGSWDEKNLASKRVVDIPGVKMVFNNMTIKGTLPMTN